MKNRFFVIFFVLLIIFSTAGFCQKLAIGQWRDHLPYHPAKAICETPGKIYCATSYAVFSYDKSDNSIERISKSSGLSDVGVSTIAFHAKSNTLLIGYNSGNLDLYMNGGIININDIKRSLITAGKSINRITIQNDLAYLACGYGISVLNLAKNEIMETWFIGNNGSYLNVNDLAFDNSKIYAATNDGLYTAFKSNLNLSNFNAWTKDTSIPAGSISQAELFAGKIYVNLEGTVYESDSVYRYNNGQWERVAQVTSLEVQNVVATGNTIAVTTQWAVFIYDNNWNLLELINSYQTQRYIEPKFAMSGENNITWIADNIQGLVKHAGPQSNEIIIPNSATSINSYQMDIKDGKLWVATGGRLKSNGNNKYFLDGVLYFEDEKWTAIYRENTPGTDTIFDIISVSVDPSDSKRVFWGSLGQGLWESYEGKISNHYNEKNSSLLSYSGFYHIGIPGLDFDAQNNLWAVNTRVQNNISAKTSAGEWKSFTVKELANQTYIGNILVTQQGHKWIELPNSGIVVFNDNGTLTNTSDDQSILLESGEGKGDLHNLSIRCLAEDLDGQVWVGTDEGITVFYSPGNVFSGSNFDAQRILVTQGGYTGYLLETENVSAIAIDGANRKWVGTQGAGVFLLSADGVQQIQHFTSENSALLSNFINCIALNDKTGEVFFGTENGICSYKSDATGGIENFSDVYAYPNPVQSGYNGPIAIKNLVKNANVKITDSGGSLVFETNALGGQAIWYGKDLNGNRVKSGVYLALCSDAEGSRTYIAKILIY